MIVREALVTHPRVLEGGASVREAAELLTHPHVESVLVVDGERLLGCVTSSSIVAAVASGRNLSALSARDLSDGEVTTIRPDAPLDEALLLMAEQGLERLAVTDDGRFLGILPREPVLRRLAEDEPPAEDEETISSR